MLRCQRSLPSLLFAAIAAVCTTQDAAATDTSSYRSQVYASLGKTWLGSYDSLAPGTRFHLERPKVRNASVARVGRPARNIRLDGVTEAEKLKSLIAGAEAGAHGYNAIHHGAKRLPALRPTQMTLREVLHWISVTPGQPHAIGRYQFIPSTLRDLIKRTGLSLNTPFDPSTQDRLADVLLHDAGFNDYQRGKLSMRDFMNNLARIWAGLPNSSGRSEYHGYAGNYATISWADYDRHMTSIFK